MEKFLDFLNSPSVLITIVSILIIAFARAIIKIFNMGVTFKSKLVTRKELQVFEAEIRKDMRGYALQIQKSVMDACLKIIDSKLEKVDGIDQKVIDIEVLKAKLESELKHIFDKYDEIKNVGDTVRNLTNKVNRIEHTESMKGMARRTEKEQ